MDHLELLLSTLILTLSLNPFSLNKFTLTGYIVNNFILFGMCAGRHKLRSADIETSDLVTLTL